MKYSFLLLFCLILGCSSLDVENLLKCERCALEDVLHSDYFSEFSKKQTEYLINGLMQNDDLRDDLLNREDELVDLLSSYQGSDLVCPWGQYEDWASKVVFYGKHAISQLTPNMRARILYGINHFEPIENSYAIGSIIEKDLADTDNKFVLPAEYGGLISLVNGKAVFVPIASVESFELDNYFTVHSGNFVESDDFTREVVNSGYIIPPFVPMQYPHISRFHLHATTRDYENKEPCGPSIGFKARPMRGDIKHAYVEANTHGQYHTFVISNIATRTFAVHYLGAERVSSHKIVVVVVDLPIHIY